MKVLLICAMLFGGAPVMADVFDDLEAAVRRSRETPPLEIRGCYPCDGYRAYEEDIRRQKIEAAEALIQTIREIDRRNRALACEAGHCLNDD